MVTTPHIHINRGTNTHYVVAGILKGCRKTIKIFDSKRYPKAASRAGLEFALGKYRKVWVNLCADYYDPVTMLVVRKP